METGYGFSKKFSSSEITPEGWFKTLLRTQADSVLGNLGSALPAISKSRYFGGDNEDMTSLPIWISGMISLSRLLNDEQLKGAVAEYMNRICTFCARVGWAEYGEEAAFALISCLYSYIRETDDAVYKDYLYDALKDLDVLTDTHSSESNSSYLWFEPLEAITYVYENTHEDWLISLAKKLECAGKDWLSFYSGKWPYEGRGVCPSNAWTDALNNAYAIKCGAELASLYKDSSYSENAAVMVKKIFADHGNVAGMFSGDMTMSGKDPEHAFSIAAASEAIRSFVRLYEITGDVAYMDYAEKISFNAFPAAFSDDMWAYQDTQRTNQIQCAEHENGFSTCKDDSAVFGMRSSAPEVSVGLPYFASSLYMKTDKGIAMSAFLPSTLNTKINGTPVQIICDSFYPFRDEINITVKAKSPVSFSLDFRIPSWVTEAHIKTEGNYLTPRKGSFFRLEGIWSGETGICVELHSEISLKKSFGNLCTVTKGPLLYAMPIQSEKRYTDGDSFPYSTYELFPTENWGYALISDWKGIFSKQITIEKRAITDTPFTQKTAPDAIYIYGRKIRWQQSGGTASSSPSTITAAQDKELLRLLPYACTDLRLAEFPVIKI